jgi:hypothetical protein
VKQATQQTAPASPTQTPAGPPAPPPIPMAPEHCPDCEGFGYHDAEHLHRCGRCGGTGEYNGIPDARGRLGIISIHLGIDGLQLTEDPRKVVHLETRTGDTALTLDGTEKLASRLYELVAGARKEEKEHAFAAALANGERPLESVRDQLGERAFNCLAREGVLTIERAAAMPDAELLCIVNLGFGTLERIRAVVGRGCRPEPEAER